MKLLRSIHEQRNAPISQPKKKKGCGRNSCLAAFLKYKTRRYDSLEETRKYVS